MQHLLIVCLLWLALSGALGCDRDSAPTPTPRAAQTVFADWRGITDEEKRQHLAEEMIRDGHLVGMKRDEVVVALGEPHPRPMSAAYGDPKYVVGPNGPDAMWLCIHIENGKVTRAEVRSD
jgi:hypothetical protein